jgi:LuxR family transcriptional regulator, maltose regulon positive regulatory protein
MTLSQPLETKLLAPRARKEWIERGGLVDYLAGVPARLLLVKAPAGFGKTTLVSQWDSSTAGKRAFAWISLEPEDNHPARMWWQVTSALHRACPAFDPEAVLAAFGGQVPDLAGTVLPLLLNELGMLPEPVVLVLDDYHVIKDPDCHEQVAFAVQHLPPTVQLVLITRADPALPLARLRATGEMAEIGAQDLRFRPAEMAELVAAVAAVELTPQELADLADRTEGWPAAVYLAALSLRGHPSPSAFIDQFTGNSRFIADFLVEEVLRQQPAEVRQFLARTSILHRFSAPLCQAVDQSADAAAIIDILERDNVFVVPLDDTRQWFRYHHLFAQLLRSELAREEPEILPVLHQRASAWFLRSGLADEAIRHALAARDVTTVINLIAWHWYAYVASGQVATVRRWLKALGDDVISTDPVAAHCAAWTAALSGDQESVRRWLPIVKTADHDGPLPDGFRSMQSSAALLEATFGFGGIRSMRDAAVEAIRLEPVPESPWHALARAAYATALYWCGDRAAAAQQAELALSSPSSIGLIRMLAYATWSLAEADEGDLDHAGRLASSAREIVAGLGPGFGAAPQSSLAYTATGAVAARRGRLTEARREFDRALELRRRQPGISPWATVEILLRLAPVMIDTGDGPAAADLLGEARKLLSWLPDGAAVQFARLDLIERRLRSTLSEPPARPLTEGEMTVLRLLAGTLSLREIGRELCLSQNTIKTHTRSIYRKLGVSTRHDAIAAAGIPAPRSGTPVAGAGGPVPPAPWFPARAGQALQVVEPG